MPNYCYYSMQVTGKNRKNVEEFVKVMEADYNCTPEDPLHFWRVFEADHGEIEEKDGAFTINISGNCAWSVSSCMFNLHPSSYQACDKTGRGTTIPEQSKRLSLIVEIFSEEPGCCFQEHFLVKFGEILTNDCEDWFEYYIDDYTDDYCENPDDGLTPVERLNAELGTELTEEMFDDDGYCSVGGFGDWDFENFRREEWRDATFSLPMSAEKFADLINNETEYSCHVEEVGFNDLRGLTIILDKPKKDLLSTEDKMLLYNGEFDAADAARILKTHNIAF